MSHPALPPRVRAIVEAVARERGVAVAAILGRGMDRPTTDARGEAMRAVRAIPGPLGKVPSVIQIGIWFNRHHTSVMAAIGGGRATAEPGLRPIGEAAARVVERLGETLP